MAEQHSPACIGYDPYYGEYRGGKCSCTPSNNNSRLVPGQLPPGTYQRTPISSQSTAGAGVASNGHSAACNYWSGYICSCGFQPQSRSQARPELGSSEQQQQEGLVRKIEGHDCVSINGPGSHLKCKHCPFLMSAGWEPLSDKKYDVCKPQAGLAKRRTLRWKHKEWAEGTCRYCNQKRALIGIYVNRIYDMPSNWACCTKCAFKLIEDLEKVASELRAAQAGGEWSEERMVKE